MSSTIQIIKSILEELIAVGVNEVAFEPTTDNKSTLIRGASSDHNIIVYDTYPDLLVPSVLGIQNVRAFYSRISLFDLEKASVNFEKSSKSDKIVCVEIKQGRRKVTYKPAQPATLSIPKAMPTMTFVGNEVVFAEDAVDSMMNIFQSMSMTGKKEEQHVAISVESGELELSFSDGESDSFVDKFDVEGEDIPRSYWNMDPFKRVIKQAAERTVNKSAKLSITEHGIAVFDMIPISVMVAPLAK